MSANRVATIEERAPSSVGDRISAFLSRNPSIRRSASVLFLEKIRPTSSRSR